MDPLETTPKKTFLEKIGPILFIGFIFLLPLFIVPALSISFMASKAILAYLGVYILFILWLFDRMRAGTIAIPWSPILLLGGVLSVVYFISAFFSPTPWLSVFGRGFELDTALSILTLSLGLFLVTQIFRTKQAIFNFYIALLASFGVVFLYELIRLIAGPSVFTFGGVLTSAVSNLVGSWNDLGIFAGLVTVISLIMLEIIPPRGILKILLYSALGLSLFVLALVNFNTLWYVLLFLSFTFLVYMYSFAPSMSSEGEEPPIRRRSLRIAKSPLIVLTIALIFTVTGPDLLGKDNSKLNLGNALNEALGISQLEARPSWGTTFAVAKNTISSDPVLGSGPNRFVYEWMKFKPKVVNESAFWNIEFNYGIGVIPSAVVSTGIVGILAWIALLCAFLYQGFRSLRRPQGDLFAYYLGVTSFVGALYLWVMAIFYTVSLVPFLLAFIFTGLALSSFILGGTLREKVISYGASQPSARFAVLVLLSLFIVGSGAALVLTAKRHVAAAYFNNALVNFNKTGDLVKAEVNVRRAIAIQGDDMYYRGLSQIALASLNQAAAAVTPQSPPDQVRNQFQILLSGAIASAQAARDANPPYYQNWISLAQAYESVVPLKIAGAYDNSKQSYEEALKRNPTNPAINLALARLAVLNNDAKTAKEQITQAVAQKSNFTEAIFLLSQIQVAEGDLQSATKSVESAATINPNDPTVFFQLGFLYYNSKSFDKAIPALLRAVLLQPTYANARYFLGLSYDNKGDKAKALEQFEIIQKTNPDNAEVKLIISNLSAGRRAFENVQPPLDNKPEKRKTLPVTDTEAPK